MSEVRTYIGLGSNLKSPERQLLALWVAAGVPAPRIRRLSLGGGVVVWGARK